MARIEDRLDATGVRVKYRSGAKKGQFKLGLRSYWVCWDLDEKRPNGRSKVGQQKAGTSYDNAKKIKNEIERQLTLGQVGLDTDNTTTTKEAYEIYLAWKRDMKGADGKPRFSPETIRAIETSMKRFLTTYGHKTLCQWLVLRGREHRAPLLQEWYDTDLQKYSVNGVNFRYRTIKTFFEWCVTRGYMEKNPLALIETMPDQEVGREISPEEIELILSKGCEFNKELRDIILVFLSTGLRLSACLWLEAKQITPFGLQLEPRSRASAKSRSKTKKSNFIPINPKVMHILKRVETGRIFATWKNAWSLEHAWSRALGRAKITERTRIHDLRHTAATWLLKFGGWTLDEVQKFLGHTSKKTTERYAHHEQLVQQKLQEKMNSMVMPIQVDQEPQLNVV